MRAETTLKTLAFSEETVYNSDRHVGIMLLFARSDAHAMEEVTFLLYGYLSLTSGITNNY